MLRRPVAGEVVHIFSDIDEDRMKGAVEQVEYYGKFIWNSKPASVSDYVKNQFNSSLNSGKKYGMEWNCLQTEREVIFTNLEEEFDEKILRRGELANFVFAVGKITFNLYQTWIPIQELSSAGVSNTMKEDAVSSAKNALRPMADAVNVNERILEEFEAKHGPGWQCFESGLHGPDWHRPRKFDVKLLSGQPNVAFFSFKLGAITISLVKQYESKEPVEKQQQAIEHNILKEKEAKIRLLQEKMAVQQLAMGKLEEKYKMKEVMHQQLQEEKENGERKYKMLLLQTARSESKNMETPKK